MGRHDDFVKDDDHQISMCAGKHRYVHGHSVGVRLIQSHAKVSLPAEQQKNEDSDVHQTDSC